MDEETQGRARLDVMEATLVRLSRRKDIREADRQVLERAALDIAWDDAIHIAAPWEPRSSLCGQWFRNLASLDAPPPDSVSGCWTCLMAADWLRKARAA
jgi:hypothetical protein